MIKLHYNNIFLKQDYTHILKKTTFFLFYYFIITLAYVCFSLTIFKYPGDTSTLTGYMNGYWKSTAV